MPSILIFSVVLHFLFENNMHCVLLTLGVRLFILTISDSSSFRSFSISEIHLPFLKRFELSAYYIKMIYGAFY